mmetsp:Transcript_36316/g.91724  ORF Transcript_36316/g.91724 Transcript_36316/m.91724 type:complete len:93 (+) Transcript_36316:136-414(+)
MPGLHRPSIQHALMPPPPCLCRVSREFPGELEKIKVWFRDYKTPDGKPQNGYGYDDKCLNKEFTMGVIAETNAFYNKLKSGARVNDEGLSLF